jgi:hypothetical protein
MIFCKAPAIVSQYLEYKANKPPDTKTKVMNDSGMAYLQWSTLLRKENITMNKRQGADKAVKNKQNNDRSCFNNNYLSFTKAISLIRDLIYIINVADCVYCVNSLYICRALNQFMNTWTFNAVNYHNITQMSFKHRTIFMCRKSCHTATRFEGFARNVLRNWRSD